MKTIYIDESADAAGRFVIEAGYVEEMELVETFHDAAGALDYVERETVELVVIDAGMLRNDAVALGWALRRMHPDIMLVFMVEKENLLLDLLPLHPVALVAKPFREEEIRYVAESAYLLSKRRGMRIYARTFGHFDLFVDGKPVMFKSAKAKEFLALLIDRRGGTVSTDQMISVLWEDRPNDESTQNLCSKLVRTLQKELREVDAEEILMVKRGNRSVDTEKFQCDLYELLDGNQKMRAKYAGEYLMDYSWSEDRMALLDRFLHN